MPTSMPASNFLNQHAALNGGNPQHPTLPMDLENVVPDGNATFMDLDMEAVLRHELSQTIDNQLRFDL